MVKSIFWASGLKPVSCFTEKWNPEGLEEQPGKKKQKQKNNVFQLFGCGQQTTNIKMA